MAVVAAGSVIRIECALTDERRRLHAALDSLPPGDGPDSLAAAVVTADDLIGPAERGRILVLTGGPRGLEPAALRAPIVVDATGRPAENVGITRFEARARPNRPAHLELLCELTNAGAARAVCPVAIEFRGVPLAHWQLEVGPGETIRKLTQLDNPLGGLLVARLEHSDAFAADNVAACEVPERRKTRVTLISPGGRAVETALASLSAVELTVLKDVPAQAPQADLLVWDGLVPDRLPRGANLVLAPERNCDLWTIGPVATGPATVLEEIESPAVSQVDFTETVLEDPIRLEFRLPADVLVRSSAGDPIYSRLARPEGDVLVLQVRIDKTDLAARGSLPILLADALRSFGLDPARYVPAVTTADMVAIRPELDARQLQPPAAMTSPAGENLDRRIEPGQTVVGPLDRVGIWQIAAAKNAPTGDGAAAGTPNDGAANASRPERSESAGSGARRTEEVDRPEPTLGVSSQLVDRRETARAGAADSEQPADMRTAAPGDLTSRAWPLRHNGPLWPALVLAALALAVMAAWLAGQAKIAG